MKIAVYLVVFISLVVASCGPGTTSKKPDTSVPDTTNRGPDAGGRVSQLGLQDKIFSAGLAHNCFIKKDDTVKCIYSDWLVHFDAKFEDINKTPIKAKVLSAGYAHTCAILFDDSVRCWNDNRKVPFGTGANHDEPRTNFSAVQHEKVLDIAAGGFHTCAIKASNNEVACWGDNTRNQITTIMNRFDKQKVKSISAGYEGLCGITLDDELICSDDISLTGFEAIKGKKIKVIKAYSGYACAIKSDDSLSCWGTMPEAIKNVYDSQIRDKKVLQISLGSENICLLLAADQQLYCYGGNSYGQTNATKIAELNKRKPKAVFSGSMHTCVVDAEDKLSCLGWSAELPHIKDMQDEIMK